MSNYIFQRNGGPLVKWGAGGLGRPPAPHVAGETRGISGIGSYEAVGRRAGTPEILTGMGSVSTGITALAVILMLGVGVVIAEKVIGAPKLKSNPARRGRRVPMRRGTRRMRARARYARRKRRKSRRKTKTFARHGRAHVVAKTRRSARAFQVSPAEQYVVGARKTIKGV